MLSRFDSLTQGAVPVIGQAPHDDRATRSAWERRRGEATIRVPHTSQETKVLNLATTQVWVRDQDEAVEFWTKKVGFEVKEDVTIAELGNFRWVTVGPKGQAGTAIVLMTIPGEPVMDDATRAQVQQVVDKGFATAVFFTCDDARAEYDRLVTAGVDTTGEPTEQVYGLDFGFRDPSGNHFRVTTRSS